MPRGRRKEEVDPPMSPMTENNLEPASNAMEVVTYKLVGYDQETERLIAAYRVPAELVAQARRFAGLDRNDGSLIADRPLTSEQAHAIAQLLGTEADLGRLDFFLEPYVVPVRRSTR
jgi:hypothetical protein